MIPMPLYAILRFQKCKTGGVACRDRHNERKKVEYKSNPNIDLVHLNQRSKVLHLASLKEETKLLKLKKSTTVF